MKTGLIWSCVLWAAIIVEQSRPDIIPSAALFLPLAVGCLFWIDNSTGIIISGLFLIVSDVLRPGLGLLELASILLPATWWLTRNNRDAKWTSAQARLRNWSVPVLITLVGQVTHSAGVTGAHWNAFGAALMTRIVIAAPIAVLMIGLLRISDEFGLRRLNARP